MATLCATGRLGRPAELKTTQKGTKVLEFSIAVDQGWGDTKTTMWLKCTMFGDRGEKLAGYLDKGTIVEVAGTPSVEAWASKQDGKPAAAIKVTVNDLKLHGGGKRDEPVADRGKATRGQPEPGAIEDDEVPF